MRWRASGQSCRSCLSPPAPPACLPAAPCCSVPAHGPPWTPSRASQAKLCQRTAAGLGSAGTSGDGGAQSRLPFLPDALWHEVLSRAGPRACARFCCASKAALAVAESPGCWRGVRGIGHLTIDTPCGLEESYLPPDLDAGDMQVRRGGGAAGKLRLLAWDPVEPLLGLGMTLPWPCRPAQGSNEEAPGLVTELPEAAVVRGRKTSAWGRIQRYRPLTLAELLALSRRCTEVEELALELTEDSWDQDGSQVMMALKAIAVHWTKLKKLILPGLEQIWSLRDDTPLAALREVLLVNAGTLEMLDLGSPCDEGSAQLNSTEVAEVFGIPEFWRKPFLEMGWPEKDLPPPALELPKLWCEKPPRSCMPLTPNSQSALPRLTLARLGKSSACFFAVQSSVVLLRAANRQVHAKVPGRFGRGRAQAAQLHLPEPAPPPRLGRGSVHGTQLPYNPFRGTRKGHGPSARHHVHEWVAHR